MISHSLSSFSCCRHALKFYPLLAAFFSQLLLYTGNSLEASSFPFFHPSPYLLLQNNKDIEAIAYPLSNLEDIKITQRRSPEHRNNQEVSFEKALNWLELWFLPGLYRFHISVPGIISTPKGKHKKKRRFFNLYTPPPSPGSLAIAPPTQDTVSTEQMKTNLMTGAIDPSLIMTDKMPSNFKSEWVWVVVTLINQQIARFSRSKLYKHIEGTLISKDLFHQILSSGDPYLPIIAKNTCIAFLANPNTPIKDKELLQTWLDYMMLDHDFYFNWRQEWTTQPATDMAAINLQSSTPLCPSKQIGKAPVFDWLGIFIASSNEITIPDLMAESQPAFFKSRSFWFLLCEIDKAASLIEAPVELDSIFNDETLSHALPLILFEIFSSPEYSSKQHTKSLAYIELLLDCSVCQFGLLCKWRDVMTQPKPMDIYSGSPPENIDSLPFRDVSNIPLHKKRKIDH